MSIVVEDGSVVSGANSYVTLEEVESYCEDRGFTAWASASDTDQEAALHRAMDYVESQEYKGSKTAYDNPLEWPRVGWFYQAYDINQFRSVLITDYEAYIPPKLKTAVCRAAYEELIDPGCLQKTLTQEDYLVSQDIAGAISTTYDVSKSGPAAYVAIDALLKDLLVGLEVRIVRT